MLKEGTNTIWKGTLRDLFDTSGLLSEMLMPKVGEIRVGLYAFDAACH